MERLCVAPSLRAVGEAAPLDQFLSIDNPKHAARLAACPACAQSVLSSRTGICMWHCCCAEPHVPEPGNVLVLPRPSSCWSFAGRVEHPQLARPECPAQPEPPVPQKRALCHGHESAGAAPGGQHLCPPLGCALSPSLECWRGRRCWLSLRPAKLPDVESTGSGDSGGAAWQPGCCVSVHGGGALRMASCDAQHPPAGSCGTHSARSSAPSRARLRCPAQRAVQLVHVQLSNFRSLRAHKRIVECLERPRSAGRCGW